MMGSNGVATYTKIFITALLSVGALLVVLNTKASFALLVASTVVASALYIKEYKAIYFNRLSLAIVLFFGFALLATLWSSNPDIGLERVTHHTIIWLFLPVLIYFFAQNKKLAKIVAIAFLIGFKLLIIKIVMIKFGVIDAGNYSGYVKGKNYIITSHQLGVFGLISLYIALSSFREHKIKQAFYWLFWTIFTTFVIFSMNGRMGYISFVIATLFLIVVFFANKKRVMVVASLLFVAVVGVSYIASDAAQSRVAYSNKELSLLAKDDTTSSLGQRVDMWRAGFAAWKDSPIWGQGNMSREKIAQISQIDNPEIKNYWGKYPNRSTALHSSYMDTLAQFGLLGLIFAIYLFIGIIKKLATSKHGKILGTAILLHFLVSNITDSHFWTRNIVMALIIFIAYLVSEQNENSATN